MQKRGIHGPSICYMCRKTNESIEHILNNCEIVEIMWNGIARTFMQTDRDSTNINTTIIKWWKGGFKSEVLNRAWRLSLGFILWGIWKERNHRIFIGEFNNINQIWQKMVENVRETILVEKWTEDDWKTNGIENQILATLKIETSNAVK